MSPSNQKKEVLSPSAIEPTPSTLPKVAGESYLPGESWAVEGEGMP